MHEPTLLDLFSGIGGFSLAFESVGFRTIGFCEIDTDASSVLRKHWPDTTNFKDIKKFCRRAYEFDQYESNEDGEIVFCRRCNTDFGECECVGSDAFCDEYGFPDVITGGVPCQPASAIGKMRGTSDERWLWPEAIRVVRELMPRFCVFENPTSILTLERGRAWNGIVSGLAALSYNLQWDVIPAAAANSGHLRERVILVASDPNRSRLERHTGNEPGSDYEWKHIQKARGPITAPDLRNVQHDTPRWFASQSPVQLVVNGIPSRVAESALRCVGNSICPQVAQIFAQAIYNELMK